jgi:hypothetical protein
MIQLAGWLAGSPRQQCICSQQTDALSILNSNSMRFRFKNPVHAVTPLFKYANWMLFTAIYFFFFKKEKLNWMLPTAPRPKI